jgi:Domain of unknown function (DUF4136)
MKIKTILAAGLLFSLGGCLKEPNLDDLKYEQVVATDRDLTADFKTYATYHIGDTVAYVSDNPKDSIITGTVAQQLVTAVKNNMNARGYTFVARTANPDLGLRLTVIKDITRTAVCGGWWDGWWGYYPPGWWGGYGGYYYPWCTSYTYSVGTSMLYMYDIKNARSRTNNNIRALWGATMFGVFSNTNNQTNVTLTINAIDQSFKQSTYIQR